MTEPSLELPQAMVQRVIDGENVIRADLANIKADVIELKERIGLLEGQSASISCRIDRMGGDIEHIKRRLDLVDS